MPDMIAPVRHVYAQRVAGTRVAAGARNVADSAENALIQDAAASKRTGAQEESLVLEGSDYADHAANGLDAGESKALRQALDFSIDHSLAWDERMREATKAYRDALEYVDKPADSHKPGDHYDAPF